MDYGHVTLTGALLVLGGAALLGGICGSVWFSTPLDRRPPAPRRPVTPTTPSDYYEDPDGTMLALRVVLVVCGLVAVLIGLSAVLQGASLGVAIMAFGFLAWFAAWAINRRTHNPLE